MGCKQRYTPIRHEQPDGKNGYYQQQCGALCNCGYEPGLPQLKFRYYRKRRQIGFNVGLIGPIIAGTFRFLIRPRELKVPHGVLREPEFRLARRAGSDRAWEADVRLPQKSHTRSNREILALSQRLRSSVPYNQT